MRKVKEFVSEDGARSRMDSILQYRGSEDVGDLRREFDASWVTA